MLLKISFGSSFVTGSKFQVLVIFNVQLTDNSFLVFVFFNAFDVRWTIIIL